MQENNKKINKFIISNNTEINKSNVAQWLKDFQTNLQPRLSELQNFFDGDDNIDKIEIDNKKINNKIHVNLADMIVNNSVSYFIGKPIDYNFKKEFSARENIIELQEQNDEETEDESIAIDCSIFGVGYELISVKDDYEENIGKKYPYYKRINPLNTFLVLDNTILENKVCAVTYTSVKETNKTPYNKGYIYTKDYIYEFTQRSGVVQINDSPINNSFGYFPVAIYKNNSSMKGDFEAVTELLSASSKLMSCSFDDQESIANALLLFYNAVMDEDAKKELNSTKVLNLLGENVSAEYIYKKLDSASFEKLRMAVRDDIFTISKVPDFTDKNFGGNQAGIALSYKLLGFENLRQNKVKYFKRGLNERWKTISSYKAGKFVIKPGDITQTFYPNIPENIAQDLEYAQLHEKGAISRKTMLSKMEIVKDVEAEEKLLDEEEAQSLKKAKDIIQNEEVPQPKPPKLRA